MPTVPANVMSVLQYPQMTWFLHLCTSSDGDMETTEGSLALVNNVTIIILLTILQS